MVIKMKKISILIIAILIFTTYNTVAMNEKKILKEDVIVDLSDVIEKLNRLPNFFLQTYNISNKGENINPNDETYQCNDETLIKIAVYNMDDGTSGYQYITDYVLNGYNWTINNKNYRYNANLVSKQDIINGKLTSDNYHLIVMPGGFGYWKGFFLFDGDSICPLNSFRWHYQVKKFLNNGGGYLGVCAGSVIASQCKKEPDNIFPQMDFPMLRITNLYANHGNDEEAEYAFQANSSFAGVPLNVEMEHSGHPVFDPFYFDYASGYRKVSFSGGPGLYRAMKNDPRLGEITVLATYVEEPMDIGPLHDENGDIIKTDMKGQYSAISTLYNQKSRIIIYSFHPEAPIWFDGHIVEDGYSYTWSGEQSVPNYNWWMLLRGSAWVSKIVPDEDLPSDFVE